MIDIKDIYLNLIEPNIQLIIIIFFFSLLVIQKLDTMTLLLFLIILFVIVFHKNIFSTLNELNQNKFGLDKERYDFLSTILKGLDSTESEIPYHNGIPSELINNWVQGLF